MQLKNQKVLASQILKCGKGRVKFDPTRLEEIKESITKADIKSLVNDKAIIARPIKGVSRVRARKIIIQKRKNQRSGIGSRKGKKTARLPKKKVWMNRIRIQRELLKQMRDKKIISTSDYRMLYAKSKGGFFRSKRHIKLFIEEKKIAQK